MDRTHGSECHRGLGTERQDARLDLERAGIAQTRSAVASTMGPMTDTWLRQPDESDPAFTAFACYRDMGGRRTVRSVAQELRKSASLIARWSSQHTWQQRVRAWDAE